MDPDRLLARLRRHHQDIERCLRDGRRALAADDACGLKALGLVRWQLMRALRAYQLFKHVELFDPLIAHGAPPRRLAATALKRRCVLMGERYGAHVARWGLGTALHAWPDYLRAAEAMAERICRHLAAEAEGVERLLAGLADVPHAPGPADPPPPFTPATCCNPRPDPAC